MKIETIQTKKIENNIHEKSKFSIVQNQKMFDILSSKVYSDPIMAPIRELFANALDSHTLGNVTKPIEIKISTRHPFKFAIRDFGSGMSKNTIEKLYTTYGWSDKSNSNDAIGCMGIGSKSPFAYIDQFSVTSFFGGKKYMYIASKNDEGIPELSLLSTTDTDEPTGLLVSFNIISEDDVKKFIYNTEKISRYIDNSKYAIYINEEEQTTHKSVTSTLYTNDELKYKIIRRQMTDGGYMYDYYNCMYDYYNIVKIIMGGIPYEYNRKLICSMVTDKIVRWLSQNPEYNMNYKSNYGTVEVIEDYMNISDLYGISHDLWPDEYYEYILSFDIGDLSISASREQIGEDKRTSEIVSNRLLDIIIYNIKRIMSVYNDNTITDIEKYVRLINLKECAGTNSDNISVISNYFYIYMRIVLMKLYNSIVNTSFSTVTVKNPLLYIDTEKKLLNAYRVKMKSYGGKSYPKLCNTDACINRNIFSTCTDVSKFKDNKYSFNIIELIKTTYGPPTERSLERLIILVVDDLKMFHKYKNSEDNRPNIREFIKSKYKYQLSLTGYTSLLVYEKDETDLLKEFDKYRIPYYYYDVKSPEKKSRQSSSHRQTSKPSSKTLKFGNGESFNRGSFSVIDLRTGKYIPTVGGSNTESYRLVNDLISSYTGNIYYINEHVYNDMSQLYDSYVLSRDYPSNIANIRRRLTMSIVKSLIKLHEKSDVNVLIVKRGTKFTKNNTKANYIDVKELMRNYSTKYDNISPNDNEFDTKEYNVAMTYISMIIDLNDPLNIKTHNMWKHTELDHIYNAVYNSIICNLPLNDVSFIVKMCIFQHMKTIFIRNYNSKDSDEVKLRKLLLVGPYSYLKGYDNFEELCIKDKYTINKIPYLKDVKPVFDMMTDDSESELYTLSEKELQYIFSFTDMIISNKYKNVVKKLSNKLIKYIAKLDVFNVYTLPDPNDAYSRQISDNNVPTVNRLLSNLPFKITDKNEYANWIKFVNSVIGPKFKNKK